MSTTIVMPKAGLTMVEGTISRWLVTEGAHVKKGDALMEYENEKNTIECDALADGYVHILAQEGNFLAAGGNQGFAFFQNVLRLPAPLPATDVRNNTVTAEIIAAIHNGYPAFQGVVPEHRQTLGNGTGLVLDEELPLFLRQHPVENLRELPEMMGGEYAVDVGIAFADALHHLRLARHTTAEENFLLRVAALGVGQGPQITEYPLLGVLPDGAGVHDDHVRALGAADDGVAALGEEAPQLFGIGLVLLAAIGLHVGGGGASLCLPVGGNFITAGELGVQFGLRNDGGFGVHVGNPPDTISI